MTGQENLHGFIREIMGNWPDGDVEGDTLEAIALKYGLIKLKAPSPDKPCCDECTCRENFDLKDFTAGNVECYERTELLESL